MPIHPPRRPGDQSREWLGERLRVERWRWGRRHDRDVQNVPRQLGNALKFILKEANAAYANQIGTIVDQLRYQLFVGPRVQRCFKDFNMYAGIVPPGAASHIHEPDGRDVNLRRNQATDPAPLIVRLDQQNPTAFRQLRQQVAGWLLC